MSSERHEELYSSYSSKYKTEAKLSEKAKEDIKVEAKRTPVQKEAPQPDSGPDRHRKQDKIVQNKPVSNTNITSFSDKNEELNSTRALSPEEAELASQKEAEDLFFGDEDLEIYPQEYDSENDTDFELDFDLMKPPSEKPRGVYVPRDLNNFYNEDKRKINEMYACKKCNRVLFENKDLIEKNDKNKFFSHLIGSLTFENLPENVGYVGLR